MSLDPIDLLTSTGGSLFRRILSFFAYGWVGLLLGRIATAFQEWENFLHPGHAFSQIFEGPHEIMVFLCWPGFVLVGLAKIPWLFLVCLPLIGFSFLAIVYGDNPSPFWALALIAGMSLTPLAMGETWILVSWITLAFEWTGLGSLGWWLYQRYHGPLEPAFVWLPETEENPDAPVRKGDEED